MKTKSFSIRKRANSFRFAWEGICNFFSREHNAWLHLVATAIAFTAAGCMHVSLTEWALLLIVTGTVWSAEIFNTAIERIMDFISPEFHAGVKRVKDLAAAAVLIASFIALLTGALIFIPKIF